MRRPRSPTKSSSTMASASAVSWRRQPAPPQAALFELKVGGAARALLPIERDEDDRGPDLAWPDGPGEHGQDGRARGAVVRAREAREVLGVVVGTHHHPARGSRPRTTPTTLRKPPGTGWKRPTGRALPDPVGQLPRGGRPSGPRPQRHLAAHRLEGGAAIEAVELRLGHRGGGAAPSPRDERDVVCGHEHDQRHAERDLHGEHCEQRLHSAALWQSGSAHDAGSQGPAHCHRRLVPASGAHRLPHARWRSHHRRGATAFARGVRGAPRVSAASGPALPPEAVVPALRDGPAVLDRRRPVQSRLPRAPHRTALARLAGAVARAGGPGVLPAPRPVQAVVGDLARPGARRRPLRADLQDPPRAGGRGGRRGHRHRAVRPDGHPQPAGDEHPWEPSPQPSQAELVAEGVKGLIRTPARWPGRR